jgi:hypothetical protein
MYIDSEASAREYIRTWSDHLGISASNATRFVDAARSQRRAAGLCKNETEREGHITAARTLEAEAALIERDLLNTLDTDEE